MQTVAKTPVPPYYAVIFTSVRTDGDNGYGAAAKRMLELASKQSGFLGFETARQEIGISVSYWSSLEAIKAWKENAEHRESQKKANAMNEYWSDCIRSIQPYSPGEQLQIAQLIKLNTNENPYPPSPSVLGAIQQATCGDLRLYPDPEGNALKHIIAELHGLTKDHIFLGNGSDEVLAHTFLSLLKHKWPILFPDISYSFYPVYCALYGIEYETVPLDDNFQVNIFDYRRPNGGIVLPNPNAPTGSAVSQSEIRSLLELTPHSVVVVDEAYVDFGGESVIPLVEKFENLIVVQTLSKSRSLAGLRVGFAIGNPSLIEALNLVKGCFNSYPLDRLALAGAEAALRDTDYFEATRQQVINSREWLAEELKSLGFYVLPSKANFLFVRHTSFDAKELQQLLREQCILVRHFAKERIVKFLRISVGTMEECRTLVHKLREILKYGLPPMNARS